MVMVHLYSKSRDTPRQPAGDTRHAPTPKRVGGSRFYLLRHHSSLIPLTRPDRALFALWLTMWGRAKPSPEGPRVSFSLSTINPQCAPTRRPDAPVLVFRRSHSPEMSCDSKEMRLKVMLSPADAPASGGGDLPPGTPVLGAQRKAARLHLWARCPRRGTRTPGALQDRLPGLLPQGLGLAVPGAGALRGSLTLPESG